MGKILRTRIHTWGNIDYLRTSGIDDVQISSTLILKKCATCLRIVIIILYMQKFIIILYMQKFTQDLYNLGNIIKFSKQ